ncbi:ParB N-terminal domain-containing protein [Ruegeria arenilitoris]|uniref:ParB N-terminal domain-containing protein n=1 Tax=Ruegeria arenilitoris TaxID=1173585 RepID=UPI00147E5058|nr:ParB N-terminal domain-containing protein [Ruegeria arenilitoris]
MAVPTSHTLLPVDELVLDVDNPRIQRIMEMWTGEITAEIIHLALGSGRDTQDSGDTGTTFYSLKESIRTSGTIIHPIHVNKTDDGQLVVVEGNTRVAIYKELRDSDVEGNWDKIPAIVYEGLSQEGIDSIRLQSHQVGPRAWDPYSKAKYLHKLHKHQDMPFARLVDLCGGRKNEVRDYIAAYEDMEEHYRPILDDDADFDATRFSSFAELQKSKVKEAITLAGHSLEDFSGWVRDRKIHPQHTVRKLPLILGSPEAKKIFLHEGAEAAIRYLDRTSETDDPIEGSLPELCKAVLSKLRAVTWPDIQKHRSNKESAETQAILDLNDELADFVKEISN